MPINPVLAIYEPAARIYCANAGVDPDEEIPVPHPLGIAVLTTVPRWTIEAERLIDLSMMLTAMKQAARAPAAPSVGTVQ